MWRRIKLIVGWISFMVVTGEAALVVMGAYMIRTNYPSTETQKRSGQGPLFSSTITQGSGFFINETNEIITNRHVVEACRRISVAGVGFHGIRGKIIAISDIFDTDLAVIRVPTRPPAVANFLDLQPTDDKSLEILSGPFALVGFPGSDRGVTSITQKMTAVKLSGAKGTSKMFVEADGPNERGESGSPLFDGSGHVIGIMFAGSTTLRDMQTESEVSEKGIAVYTPNVIDWLKHSGVGFSTSRASQSEVLPTSAIVEIFCFK